MHQWTVAGGLVERAGSLLLVRNRRRDGRVDWSPPGGVVDPGESVLVGLGREVLEETGLAVATWIGPAYLVDVTAPDMGWHLTVEVHRADRVTGDLRVEDPDGIVEQADYVEPPEVPDRLVDSPRWVTEPLLHWLEHRPDRPRTFRYEVRGRLGDGLSVEPLA